MNRCLNSASCRNLWRIPCPSELSAVSVKFVFSLGIVVSKTVVSVTLVVESVYAVSASLVEVSVYVGSGCVYVEFVVSVAVSTDWVPFV